MGEAGDATITGDGVEVIGQVVVNEGDDYIDGGDGNDLMFGGSGDTLLGDNLENRTAVTGGNEVNNIIRGNALANLIDAGDITFSRSKYGGEYWATSTFFSLAENFFEQHYCQECSTCTGSMVFVNTGLQSVSLGLHTSAI